MNDPKSDLLTKKLLKLAIENTGICFDDSIGGKTEKKIDVKIYFYSRYITKIIIPNNTKYEVTQGIYEVYKVTTTHDDVLEYGLIYIYVCINIFIERVEYLFYR